MLPILGGRFRGNQIEMTNKSVRKAIFTAQFLPIVTVGLAAGIFIADALTPPDCVVSGLYVVVVLLTGRFCGARKLWGVCVGCAGLTALAQLLAHRLVISSDGLFYIGTFNMAVSIVAIGLSGYLVLRGQISEAALLRSQADLAHVSRVTTMGELTASIAHEVNQPIAGVVTNAGACLRWLAAVPPQVEEARAAASRIVRDGTRAAEIISRIRQIFIKSDPQRRLTDINLLARETVDLLGKDTSRYSIAVRTELAAEVGPVMADPVQLQQVIVNLIVNSIDAMKDITGSRILIVKSWRPSKGGAALSVSDSGKGLPNDTEHLFKAFFTTKSHGTGMGLSISRSIIEAHQGVLSGKPNHSGGATFQFHLPPPEAP
jgi:signal transduction histidine kinase